MVEQFPSFDHKPVLMRAYKAADSSGDGLIDRREFRKLLYLPRPIPSLNHVTRLTLCHATYEPQPN